MEMENGDGDKERGIFTPLNRREREQERERNNIKKEPNLKTTMIILWICRKKIKNLVPDPVKRKKERKKKKR